MGCLRAEVVAFLRSAALAFSTFSRLPMPQLPWADNAMRYLMATFPLVGVAIGALVGAWIWLGLAASFGDVLVAAGVALIPIAVTGGIHLDGLCDVADALASNSSPERRREILKDPHIGAFAAIAVGCYLVLYVCFSAEIISALREELALGMTSEALRLASLVCLAPVLSRILSGLAVVCFPKSSSQGMLAAFQESAEKRVVAVILASELAAVAAALAWICPTGALAMLATGLACFASLRKLSDKKFGGMSGDLAGFFLQVCELLSVLFVVAVWKVIM